MFAAKFNYCVERATIVAVCLWGNWALYYWVAVLGFDASYNSLKAYTPILLLQIAVSLFYLLRTDLGFSSASHRTCGIAKRSPRFISGRFFVILSAIVVLFAAGVVLIADHFRWTRSTLSYNLFWSLLLPASLAYFFFSKGMNDDSPVKVTEEYNRSDTLDCLLFCFGATAYAIMAYGSGYLTWDDAFYGHVMSSMLANPALPVQGQDLLLGTSAPYSLHPSYRGVGYEALIALISDVTGRNLLDLYLNIFPVGAALLWSFAAYLFMRAMRAPYPGLAVVVSFLLLLFWGLGRGFSPAAQLISICWGKSQVIQMAFPLLFFAVAAYIQQQTFRTWLVLLFCVCTVAIRSSTALFVVPFAVGMATLVFLPSIRNNLRTLLATFLSLVPVLLLLAYGLMVLRMATVTGREHAGWLVVRGDEFGGLLAKSAVLVILLLLPLMARTIKDQRFQNNLFRVCMAGVFTVMTPFFMEAITVTIGLHLLSVRLSASYPGVLLIGMMAGVALTHLGSQESTSAIRRSRFLVPLLVLALYGVLIAAMERSYIFGNTWQWARAISRADWGEAEDIRKLIKDDAYVAAGRLDYFLPILPDPPSFIWVRHYLDFHKYYLSEGEYSDRKYLYTVLADRLPRDGDSLDTTMDLIATTSDKLGVTTLIFRVLPDGSKSESETARAEFITALTAHLTHSGYDCITTPSGGTRVCNREIRFFLES